MIRQTPAQIFKAQQRGAWENDDYRCYATFNFKEYNDGSRKPFGRLIVFNEVVLSPEKSITLYPQNGNTCIIIPLYGAIRCIDHTGNEHPAAPGDACIFPIVPGENIILVNPYKNEHINYLYLEVLADEPPVNLSLVHNSLDPRNLLQHFSGFVTGIKAFMGIFDGRCETVYRPAGKGTGLFVFVINGAFELQGRLLENRDGLSLWDVEEVDMEALSENAILLLLELPLT